jgi:cysteine synthase
MLERRFSVAIAFAAGVFVAIAVRELAHRGTSASKDASKARSESSQQDTDLDRQGIESIIGNTPLFVIKSLSKATGCTILAKAEFLNGAGGSPKDRVALSIIEKAEAAGLLAPHSGDTIYEGTVGSTGISLATLCRARGYLAHICMPSDQAMEKSDLLLKLGAVVDRVRPAPIVDQAHFVNHARNLAAEHTSDLNKPGRGFFADQFETEANWQTHYEGTGPEIFEQSGENLDAFVAGAGTGGTISGVATFLKMKLPNIKIILADPMGSGLFNKIKHGVMFHPKEKEGTRRRHQIDTIIEGIGLTRSTANFEIGRELIDDAVKVTDAQALAMARWLVEKDGIFVGSSSAVNCMCLQEGWVVSYADQTFQVSLLCKLLCNLVLVIVSLQYCATLEHGTCLSFGNKLVILQGQQIPV